MSLVISFMPNLVLAGFFVALFVIPQMDIRGRRFVSVYIRSASVILTALFYVLSKYCNSIEFYCVAQFLLGFVQPLKMIVVKIYLAECFPDCYRAFVPHAIGSCIIFANLFSTVLYHPSMFGSAEAWQFVPMMCVGMEVLYFCLAAWLPESPKWLMDAGRPEEAIEAIRFYHGHDENVAKVMAEIQEEIKLSSHGRMGLTEVYRNRTFRSVFVLIFMALLTSTLSMVIITQSYTQQLLLEFGYSIDNVFLFTGILQAGSIPLLFLNPYLYERLGRRPMFLFSSFCSLLNIFLFYFAQIAVDFNGRATELSLILASLGMVFNSLAASSGLVAGFVVFISDLLPPGAKVSVTQFLSSLNMFIEIPAIFLFGNLLTSVGSWTFVPFCVLQTAIFIYMFLNLPETKLQSVVSNVHHVEDHLRSRSRSTTVRATACERTNLLNSRNGYGT